ncbi:hypothetical protein COP2_035642 [Malus domestica]
MPTISILVLIFLFSFVTPSMNDEIAYDFFPFMRIYKNGTIERFMGKLKVPPSLDPKTGVQSKDVVISHKENISARLYLPSSTANSARKLPFLVYFHGGGFCVESAFSPVYHNYVNSLVAMANVVAVSVEYRLAPEHPLPIAYKDSWTTLKWVASHFDGNSSEEWLKRYADPTRVFFSGDSAGANIAHHMALKVGTEGLAGFKLNGIVLVHPFFWGTELSGAELKMPPIVRLYMAGLWRFLNPLSSGTDDPLFNPVKDPKLRDLGCQKVLVFVAEKDSLYDRGRYYSMALRRSGWKGVVKVWKTKEENHVFHLLQPTNEKAVAMMKRIVLFFN